MNDIIPRCPRCHAPLEDDGECLACAFDEDMEKRLNHLRKLWGIDSTNDALDMLIAVNNAAGEHHENPSQPR